MRGRSPGTTHRPQKVAPARTRGGSRAINFFGSTEPRLARGRRCRRFASPTLQRFPPPRARSIVHFVHICPPILSDLPMLKRPSEDWHEPFLAALGKTRNVNEAAASMGVKRDTAYRHYRKDAAFAARWDESLKWQTVFLKSLFLSGSITACSVHVGCGVVEGSVWGRDGQVDGWPVLPGCWSPWVGGAGGQDPLSVPRGRMKGSALNGLMHPEGSKGVVVWVRSMRCLGSLARMTGDTGSFTLGGRLWMRGIGGPRDGDGNDQLFYFIKLSLARAGAVGPK